MIEKLIAGMIPLAVQKIALLPMVEKRNFAAFVCLVSRAYAEGDRAGFDEIVGKLNLSGDSVRWRDLLIGALWDETNHQSK